MEGSWTFSDPSTPTELQAFPTPPEAIPTQQSGTAVRMVRPPIWPKRLHVAGLCSDQDRPGILTDGEDQAPHE